MLCWVSSVVSYGTCWYVPVPGKYCTRNTLALLASNDAEATGYQSSKLQVRVAGMIFVHISTCATKLIHC